MLGENFILDVEGTPTAVGFYTTRRVAAGSPDEAETLATHSVIHDPTLQAHLNDPSNPPRVSVEELQAIPPDHPTGDTGYAFFEENSEST